MHPDTLWQMASARWAEIGANSPDLAPALALQQRLLRIILDAASGLEPADVPDVPSATVIERWHRGLPAFRNEIVAIPQSLRNILPALCDTLASGGAGDSILHIRDAILHGEIDAGSLLGVSLARHKDAIRTSALHRGFSPDLLGLLGELASSPLAYRLQASLFDTAGLKAGLQEWDRGYCPCCGSWPAFIELVTGVRALRCSFCALSWEGPSRRCCIYCGNAGDDFVTAAPDISRRNRRVELCGACGGYTKVIEVAGATPFPLLAVEDLASMDLDEGAMSREYGRPELCDLSAIEPLRSPGCA
jgi:hypothetical protein